MKAYVEAHGHEARCIDLNIQYCSERRQDIMDDADGSIYARPDPWASEAFDEWAFEFDGEVRFTAALEQRPLPIERWADQIMAGAPQVVGFSVQFTNLGVSIQVAQCIAARDPAILIVFGGPNVAEDQSGGLALRTEVCDLVVEGEGEETLVEVLEAFEADRELQDVPGIGLLVDGVPQWTERRPLIGDVDSLPFPDFSDVDWASYPNPWEIPMMSSRGCVLNCAFCYETVYWKRFRTQSPQRIADEIDYQCKAHPLRHDVTVGMRQFDIAFADSLVNGHLGGLKRTAKLLVERQANVSWTGQATVNSKMDDEFVDLLAESGCASLAFGLESAAQGVLDSMGKRFQIGDAYAFFERVHRADIKVIVNVMVGYPTETRSDFLATLRFLRRIKPFIFMVNNVSPTGVPPGSRIHQDPEAFSVVPVDLAGWEAGDNVAWSSPATGKERDRNRRLRALHLWMTLSGIPHQGLPRQDKKWLSLFTSRRSDLPEERSWKALTPTWAPDEIQPRIDKLNDQYGAEPLVLTATAPGQVVRGVRQVPEWASDMKPRTWVGHALSELPEIMRPALGAITFAGETSGPAGEVVMDLSADSGGRRRVSGLHAAMYPPAHEGDDLVVALFPLGVDTSVR